MFLTRNRCIFKEFIAKITHRHKEYLYAKHTISK